MKNNSFKLICNNCGNMVELKDVENGGIIH